MDPARLPTAAPSPGALGLARDGSGVQGWVLPDPGEPDEAPEVALEIPGAGIRAVTAGLRAEAGSGLPAGAWLFAWSCPPGLLAGGECAVRAWHLGLGAELEGSPARLAGGELRTAAASALQWWRSGLVGNVGAAATTELAEGLWVTAQQPALSLRYEMVPFGPGGADAPPPRGVRVVADGRSNRLCLHMRPGFGLPAVGETRTVRLTAWIPAATAPAMQVQAEIWAMRREAESFVPLRRLRRVRLFRQPTEVEADLTVLEGDVAPGGEFCLSLQALDAHGLAALPPHLAPAMTAPAHMEDSRLAGAFEALRELVRLQGEARADHPLLPAAPTPAPSVPAEPLAVTHPFTEIVVPVYNGDLVVRDCLRSLLTAATGPMRVLVVDDGSRTHTAELLRAEAAADPRIALHRRDINRGYTKSINEGVLLTESRWVVILNSDTLVAPGWLDRLHRAAQARPGTGMAGPLSNAATWQSIPAVKRSDGGWSTNDAIEPRHLGQVQALLDGASERAYPEFPVLNGFCTLIARDVFDCIGLFDDDAFPMGYGEETDLCLRARRAGFRLTVADDCFVYHHKSVSFGSAARSRLTRQGGLELANKHLGVTIPALEQAMQACPPMARLRARMADLLSELD